MTGPVGRWRGIGSQVWWRQLRTDLWADVVIAILIAITCFVIASAPRVFERASRDDLADAIVSATPEQRNLLFERRGTIGSGPPSAPFVNVQALGERLHEDHVPDAVRSLISSQHWVVDSPTFVVSSFPDQVRGPFPTTFRFRYQDDLADHATLTRGASPTQHDPIVRLEGADCPDDVAIDDFEPVVDVDCAVVVLPVFETAVTQQTAADMEVDVGDLVTLTPSPNDVLFRSGLVNAAAVRFVLKISGIVELDDQGLEYWYADSSLHRPRVTENPDFRLVFAAGIISPDQYRSLNGALAGVPSKFSWRFLIDGDRVQEVDAESLRDEIAKISAPDVDLITLLPELLHDHLEQRRLALALLSLAAVGVGVAALTSIWVLASVDGTRRRRVSELMVDRGASRGQMAIHALRTATLVSVPTGGLAALAAWVALPDAPFRPSVQAILVVVAVALVCIVAVGAPAHRDADRGERRVRRIVIEISVVSVAVLVVVLLRRRERSVADTTDTGFDALLALAPGLMALVAGIVALRLLGPGAALLSRLAAHRGSAGWLVGVRRLVNQPLSVRAPIAAVAVAASIAVFAAVVSGSLTHGRELASWQAVGADARVETGNPDLPLTAALQASLESSAGEVAYGAALRFQRFGADSGGFVADVLALDLEKLDRILPIERRGGLLDGPVILDQNDPDVLPGLLVGFAATGTPQIGDVARLLIGPFSIPTEMVRHTDRFPGIGIGRPAIVVDRAMLGRLSDARTVAPTVALLGGALHVDQIDAAVNDPQALARWTSRSQQLERVSGDPLSLWTNRAMWALGLAGLALAVITATASSVITAAARRRDLGILAVLGLERGPAARLIAVELIPAVLLAAACGALAGTIGATLLGANLSLGAFAGGSPGVGIAVDWLVVCAAVVTLATASSVAVALTARSARRLDHALMLRRGDL